MGVGNGGHTFYTGISRHFPLLKKQPQAMSTGTAYLINTI